MSSTISTGSRLFKCLSEGIRLRIARLLADQELNVAELTEALGVPQSTLSRHLATLKEGDLLETRRQGNATFYRFRLPEDGRGTGAAFAPVLASMLESEPFADKDADGLARVLDMRRTKSREHFEHAGHTWDEFQDRYADHDVKSVALSRLVPDQLCVLDVGAGSGYFLPELAAAQARVIAVDHAPRQLEKARARAVELGIEDIDFREGDFAALPVKDGEADAAILHLSLHHAPDPEAVLYDLHRALKPGGTVVVTEFKSHEESWLKDEHADLWMGFGPSELSDAMKRVGFERLRLEERPFCRADHRDKSGPASDLDVFIMSGRKTPLIKGAQS